MSTRLRTQWAANVLLWLVSYLIMGARMSSSPGVSEMPYLGEIWLRRIVISVFAIAASALIGRIIWVVRSWPLTGRLLLAFAMALVAGAWYGLVNYVVFYAYLPRWEPPPALGYMLTMASLAFWVYVAWAAICFAIDFDWVLKERTRNLLTAQNLALDAENRLLRSQINPHFLFNTLNALSALIIEGRNDQAERVLLLMSKVLRRSLDRDMPDLLPLREELKAQREYLRIEQVRFGRRLRFVENVPEAFKDALVPSLILQPLVENAVKYGLGPSERPVTIAIEAQEVAGGRLCVSVVDDGGGAFQKPPQKLGLGLQNVERRLRVLYGPDAGLSCQPAEPKGFRAAIELPLRHAEPA
jgi:two-component system LytT family sensor kinase